MSPSLSLYNLVTLGVFGHYVSVPIPLTLLQYLHPFNLITLGFFGHYVSVHIPLTLLQYLHPFNLITLGVFGLCHVGDCRYDCHMVVST